MNGHGVRVEVKNVNILVAYPAENLAYLEVLVGQFQLVVKTWSTFF